MGIAIIIDWYGPYATKDALEVAMKGYDDGTKCLYMAVNDEGRVTYLGRTSRSSSRMANHEKMARTGNSQFYCGDIVSQGVAGRRTTVCKTDLGTAEHALIACLKPEHNEKLKAAALGDCVVVYSRFFDGADEEKRIEAPAAFPPLVAYDSWTKRWDAGWVARV
jgi:hypothetical protein